MLQEKYPTLFAMYGAPPRPETPPPESVPETVPAPAPLAGDDFEPVPLVPGEPGPPELEAKIAHLGELHKLRIRQLSEMMRTMPIRPYLNTDGDSGILVTVQGWQDNNQNEAAFFSDTFFGPSHLVICEVFKPELLGIGKQYGK